MILLRRLLLPPRLFRGLWLRLPHRLRLLRRPRLRSSARWLRIWKILWETLLLRLRWRLLLLRLLRARALPLLQFSRCRQWLRLLFHLLRLHKFLFRTRRLILPLWI